MGHWEGWTRGPTVGIPRRFDPSPDQASALASARPGAAHDDPLQRKALPRPRFLPAATRPIATLALAAVLTGGALPAPVVAGDVAGPIPGARSAQLDTTISVDPAAAAGPVAPAAPVVTGDDSTAVPDLHPSIAYEQAMAHEHDRIDFKPGGRVTVGFTPRARDRWPVDGRPPAALPAGRATGREMAASPQGSLWARGTGSSGAAKRHERHDRRQRVQRSRRRPRRQAGRRRVRRRLHRATRRGRRRPRRRLRPPPPGVRLPALLGALGRVDQAQQRRPVDHRLLLGRRRSRTGNLRKKDPDGTNTTGWGGWTSSTMTSVISSAHQHGTRVVLTVSVFAWTTAQANVQRALLGSARPRGSPSRSRSRPPSAIAAPTASTSTSSRSRAATPTSSSRCSRPSARELNKVRKGYQLTYDTTGFIGNYPLEASVGVGRGRRDLHHGLRLPHLRVRRPPGPSTRCRAPPTTSPTPSAPTRRASARVADHPRPPVVRPGVVDRDDAVRALEDAQRRQVRLQHRRELRERHRAGGASTAAGGTPLERSPYVAYRRQNCTSAYGCVTSWRQVYYDDAASLKQRYAIVNDYGLRGAGMWALGLRRRPLRAVPRGVAESFLVDKSAPQAGIRMLGGDPGRRGVRRLVGGARHQRRRLVRRPGLDRRRRVGHVADARPARRPTSGSARTATATRSASGRSTARATRARGTWARPGTRRRRWRPGGFGRVVDRRPVVPQRAPTRARRSSGTLDGRHDRRDHARAGLVGRLRLVRGHRADPRVVARCRSSSAASGSRRGRPSDTMVKPYRAPEQHDGRRRPPRPRLRVRARVGARLGSRRAGDPRVLAQRRRVRGRHPAALDATPSPSTR